MALYTIKHAAKILGIQENWVRALVREKDLGMKVGAMYMLSEGDMAILKARNTQSGMRKRVYRYKPVGEEFEDDEE